MKSNNLLTILLYALLLGLIVVGGYKACEMRKEKAEMAKQDAEMKKYWNDLGSPAQDTSSSSGSSYTNSSDSTRTVAPVTSSTADANGIEPDNPGYFNQETCGHHGDCTKNSGGTTTDRHQTIYYQQDRNTGREHPGQWRRKFGFRTVQCAGRLLLFQRKCPLPTRKSDQTRLYKRHHRHHQRRQIRYGRCIPLQQ